VDAAVATGLRRRLLRLHATRETDTLAYGLARLGYAVETRDDVDDPTAVVVRENALARIEELEL
jgi:hypothetical protein